MSVECYCVYEYVSVLLCGDCVSLFDVVLVECGLVCKVVVVVLSFFGVLVVVCNFDLVVMVLCFFLIMVGVLCKDGSVFGIYLFELLIVIVFIIVLLMWYLCVELDLVYCWLCDKVCVVCVGLV